MPGPIQVIEDKILPRCENRHPIRKHQCQEWDEHFGSHRVALSPTQILTWPSQDDVEDAAVTAQIEGMTEAQLEADLVDHEIGWTPERIKEWSRGTAAYVKGAIQFRNRITELETLLRDATRSVHCATCRCPLP